MQFNHVALTPDLTLPWKPLLSGCWSSLARWLHPYRPEKHYMRGPGPRCREKSLKVFVRQPIGRTGR
jgi:hypothetical protein